MATLSAGTRLGPYEVAGFIGAGGMGEVYRARDTRLDRSVAIKVLPHEFAADPDRRSRFEREARTVSGLNHPHICTLYDVGEADGQAFLVMEHLVGETLAERLKKGPLPLAQALTAATEIADALAAAHRQGIIHRDLKPGNVMLTKSGAKLLDFGLAKLAGHGEQPAAAQVASATRSTPLTGEGVIVGTLQYIAPEQLEGKPTDARTDLWALGAMLYEMVTGRPAFEGTSQASVITAIMSAEPTPISTLQPVAPPALQRVVRKCLAKAPDARWDSAHDLAEELAWIAETPVEPARPNVGTPALSPRQVLLGVLLLLAVAGAASVVTLRATRSRPTGAAVVARSVVELAPDAAIASPVLAPLGVGSPALALSPDGTLLAYAGGRKGASQLYLRPIDRFEVEALAGTEHGYGPFFSQDGRWVGFFAQGKLKKIAVDGHEPTTLCEARNPYGATWMPDGTIVFADAEGDDLVRVRQDGGVPQVVASAASRLSRLLWPQALPTGEHVLARSSTGATVLVSLRTGEMRQLLNDATGARYAPSGHILFARSGSLMAATFDLARLEVTGPALPVVEAVRTEAGQDAAQFTVSDTGTLAYLTGGASLGRLAWVNRQGLIDPIPAPERAYGNFSLSPDGGRLAVEIREPRLDIWALDFNRGALVRLTSDGDSARPVWTRDGERITFMSSKPGAPGLYWLPADGSRPPERLLADAHGLSPSSWSPDGRLLAAYRRSRGTWELLVIRLNSGGDPSVRSFLSSSETTWGAMFSPDGRWIAYSSNESGEYEVYVRPYPGPGGKWQVSTDGGEEPRWSVDGRELFYRSGQRWMVTPVTTGGQVTVGTPTVLFEGPFLNPPGPSYDVAPDGKRFLVLVPVGEDAPVTRVNLVVNWFQELRAKMPVQKSR